MITTQLHEGQGLGNQLFSYVMLRVLALDKGYDFGVMHPERFKGSALMQLDFGKSPERAMPTHYTEKALYYKDGTDVRLYDPAIKNIADDTNIKGYFQGEDYFKHRKKEIRSWLQVRLLDLPDNLCIINFRGGEYVGHKDLFLDKSYWNNAMNAMRKINPSMEFRVVTDDVRTAQKFFPTIAVSHNLVSDYAAIQSATYLILSNSSFALFPAWLNENAKCIIAPKYWARHTVSDGYWSLGYTIVDGWMYQDRAGILFDSESCKKELARYMENNKDMFTDELKNTSPSKAIMLRRSIARLIPRRMRLFLKRLSTYIR